MIEQIESHKDRLNDRLEKKVSVKMYVFLIRARIV